MQSTGKRVFLIIGILLELLAPSLFFVNFMRSLTHLVTLYHPAASHLSRGLAAYLSDNMAFYHLFRRILIPVGLFLFNY